MISLINDYDFLNTLSDYKVTKNAFNEVYAYILNDEVLGFIDYSVIYERAEINYIFVKEKYRHQGIASKLMQFMLDKIDVGSITLEVSVENIYAIKLYEKYGFKKVFIRDGYYNGIDGILMLKSR